MEPKEFKEALFFICSLASAVSKSYEDGKVNFEDVLNFIEPFKQAIPALSGLENIDEELKNVSKEHLDALVVEFKEKFDLPNEGTEALIENAFAIVLPFVKIILGFKKA